MGSFPTRSRSITDCLSVCDKSLLSMPPTCATVLTPLSVLDFARCWRFLFLRHPKFIHSLVSRFDLVTRLKWTTYNADGLLRHCPRTCLHPFLVFLVCRIIMGCPRLGKLQSCVKVLDFPACFLKGSLLFHVAPLCLSKLALSPVLPNYGYLPPVFHWTLVPPFSPLVPFVPTATYSEVVQLEKI